MDKRSFIQACSALALGPWGMNTAQSEPKKIINIIVPFAPKGVSSLLADEVCTAMAGRDYEPCTVDHVPGMTNMVATRMLLKKSNPQQITLMVAGPSIFTIGQHLNPFMSINPAEDLTILATLVKGPMVLITSAKSGLDSWEKLAETRSAKKCAVSGLGSPSHVVAAYIDSSLFSLGSAHSVDGDLPGIENVLDGKLTCAVVSIGSCNDHLKGSLNFLLSSSETPIKLPNQQTIPTIQAVAKLKQAPDFVFDNWLAIVGPRNMDPELSNTLQTQLSQAIASEKMTQLIRRLLHEPLQLTPAEMMKRIHDDARKWSDHINRLQLHQALNLSL